MIAIGRYIYINNQYEFRQVHAAVLFPPCCTKFPPKFLIGTHEISLNRDHAHQHNKSRDSMNRSMIEATQVPILLWIADLHLLQRKHVCACACFGSNFQSPVALIEMYLTVLPLMCIAIKIEKLWLINPIVGVEGLLVLCLEVKGTQNDCFWGRLSFYSSPNLEDERERVYEVR